MSVGVRLPELNVVLVNGRLTRDPDLKYTPSGAAVCNMRLAVNRRFKDPKSGEWKDDTFFIDVVVWREAAERCKERLQKGSAVSVEGRLRGREYEDRGGQKRSVLEIEARRVQTLSPAPGAPGAPGEGAEAPGRAASKGEAEAEPAPEGGETMEEVPF